MLKVQKKKETKESHCQMRSFPEHQKLSDLAPQRARGKLSPSIYSVYTASILSLAYR